ncbi:sce7726 family protein [Vibrio fluvialis]|nr:sce7726 family protein [Vibrio fluvialis]
MKVLKETDYKCITIDWLFQKELLGEDAVLINELPVDGFNRRADLVVANGKLHAFEIKSDADSLVRLQGQIDTYLRFFDKVTLVCSKKFTAKAIEILPSEVEILELTKTKNKYSLICKRRGKTNLIKSTSEYLSFVDKRSLQQSLKYEGINISPNDSNYVLYQKARMIAKNKWRNITLKYLKSKYKETFDNFLEQRKTYTNNSDLIYLSPRSLNSDESKFDLHEELAKGWEDWEPSLERESEAVDISARLARHGFVTNTPVMLIPRAKS